MYQTTTTTPLIFAPPTRCTSLHSALINRAIEQLREEVEEMDWKRTGIYPTCADSLINVLMQEVTDVIKAASRGESRMTKEEAWDLGRKIIHLCAITLEEDPFMVLNKE